MADHPVHIVQRQLRLVQHRVQTAGQCVHRKAEDGTPVHADGGRAGAAGASCVDRLVAPCAQRDRKRCVAQFKNRCARTVAEEHTGGAVGLIHQAGQRFAAHHEGVPSTQRRHQAAGHGGAVDEARAGGVDIQRGAVFGQTQRPLHLTGHTWGGVRGRKGRADTAGNILRRKTTALQRLLCRRDGQRGGGFFLRTPVAGADAGAGGDPLVAGVHGAAQLFIGDRAAGQSSAGGDQLQTVHARFASPI